MSRLSGPMRPLFFLAVALLASFAANAQTRTEILRWNHPTPSQIAGYRVYWGTTSGAYGNQRDVGVPALGSDSAYSFTLVVSAQENVYVAVSAINGQGIESAKSNERFRPGSGGGVVVPPPPPTGSAGIVRFVLWNATSDSIADSDFKSGERIDLATLPCTSIQIQGNTYLSKTNSPGSVKKVFDGNAIACTSAPTSHESNPPYVWGTGNASGLYECAPSLTQLGTHSLTAIPYDGDDCTGVAGNPVTVSFEVTSPASPPPAALGPPGRPILVQ